MRSFLLTLILVFWTSASLIGCHENEPPKRKFVSRKVTKRVRKSQRAHKTPMDEEIDDVDRAWNTTPTSGQAKVRMVMLADGQPIKGRPTYMAPRFTLVAEEMMELLRSDGHEPTGKTKSFRFNPNPLGHFVLELPPSIWRLRLKDEEGDYATWTSAALTFLGDNARTLDIPLSPKPPK